MLCFRRSLEWYVAVGLTQAALVAAVVALCDVRTVEDHPGRANALECHGKYVYSRGYPVPWEVKRQQYFKSRGAEQWGPVEDLGGDPIFPAAMMLIALTLPPVVAVALCREFQRGEGEPRALLSRCDRFLRGALLWSAGLLFLAWFFRAGILRF